VAAGAAAPVARGAGIGDVGAGSFEKDAAVVLGNLQRALAELLAAAPVRARTAAEVSRTFGVDKALGWNVHRIVSAPTPLAAGVNIPARVSVERFLRAAAERAVPPVAIARAAEAFERFDRFAAEHSEDRDELDAMIVSALPEERGKAYRARREAVFNAMRDLRGISLRTSVYLMLVHPSRAQPGRLDLARVCAWVDMRKTRRDAGLKIVAYAGPGAGFAVTTLDGHPVEDFTDVLLAEHCTRPLPRIVPHRYGATAERIRYGLESDGVGARSSFTTVFGDVLSAYAAGVVTPERSRVGGSVCCEHPCRRVIVDLLLAEGAVPEQAAEAKVYDVISKGFMQRLDDPEREEDRVRDAPAAVRDLGVGVRGFDTIHVPRYVELLERVCAARGVDGERVRGHRLEIEHPLLGWQCQLTVGLAGA
jgi:hypothetical protein